VDSGYKGLGWNSLLPRPSMQRPTETSVHNKEEQLHLVADSPETALSLVTVVATDSLQVEVSGPAVAADIANDSEAVNSAVTEAYEDYRHWPIPPLNPANARVLQRPFVLSYYLSTIGLVAGVYLSNAP
jgi:hypothetical protein